MRNSLADVVAAALRVLDAQGLENCSMRRVAAELGVQPSALYHHVSDKQTLLALMADEIVGGLGIEGLGGVGGAAGAAGLSAVGVTGSRTASGSRAASGGEPNDPRALCVALRDAMLAVRDGADVVATATAFRLGSSAVERRLAGMVGVDGARTLLLYTFGHAQATQTHRQAAAFGALLAGAGAGAGGAAVDVDQGDPDADLDASFERGLDIVLGGLGR